MRLLILGALALVMGGIGFVVVHESGKRRVPRSVANPSATIAVVSTGDRVDLSEHVPREGLCIVEFTADF